MIQRTLTILLVLIAFTGMAQTNCYIKANEKKVLANQNLDLFLDKMRTDTFDVGYRKSEIARETRQILSCQIGDTLLANSDEAWQPSEMHTYNEVTRQMVFFATSNNMFVIVYNHGGNEIHQHVVCMLLSGKKVTDIWSGNGDISTRDIPSLVAYLQENRNKPGILHGDMLEY